MATDTPSALTRAVYALAALPLAVSVPPFFLQLAPQQLEAAAVTPAALVAILAALRLLDGLATLAAGPLSDTRGAAARRRRGWWLGAGIMLLGLAPTMLGAATMGPAAFALAGALVTLGWVLLRISHLAWGAELAGGYHERTRLYTAGQAGVVLGAALGTGAPLLLLALGMPRDEALALLLIGIAGLTALAGLALWALPDRTPPAPAGELGALLRRLARIRAWRRLLLAQALNAGALALPAALLLPIAGEVVQAEHALGGAVAAYLGGALLGLPLGSSLARRLSKHGVWCAALVLAAAVLAWLLLLGPGHVAPLLVIAGLLGLTGGVDWALSAAIQADMTDAEAARTGSPRCGLHFAAWLVAGKIGLAVGGGAAALTLALADPAASAATDRIGATLLVAALGPAAAKLLAAALMWDFPLDEARHQELRARIEVAPG